MSASVNIYRSGGNPQVYINGNVGIGSDPQTGLSLITSNQMYVSSSIVMPSYIRNGNYGTLTIQQPFVVPSYCNVDALNYATFSNLTTVYNMEHKGFGGSNIACSSGLYINATNLIINDIISPYCEAFEIVYQGSGTATQFTVAKTYTCKAYIRYMLFMQYGTFATTTGAKTHSFQYSTNSGSTYTTLFTIPQYYSLTSHHYSVQKEYTFAFGSDTTITNWRLVYGTGSSSDGNGKFTWNLISFPFIDKSL